MSDPIVRPRMLVRALVLAAVALPGLALAATAPQAAPQGQHAWEAGDTPASLETWVNGKLKSADAKVAQLLAVTGARTVDNTLRPYDDAFCDIVDAQAQAQVLYGVGATRELRDKAQALTQTASAALTALGLNPGVYKALSAVPTPADAGVKHYLEHTLLEYRLAGVDKDEATRAKIKACRTRSPIAGSRSSAPCRMTGAASWPQSQLGPARRLSRSHKPDAAGKVTITTDPPDMQPVMKFADNRSCATAVAGLHTRRLTPPTEILLSLLRPARSWPPARLPPAGPI